MRFFVDNCLSPKLARVLHEASQPSHEFVHLRNRFDGNVVDEEWIRTLATEGNWVVLSGDYRILKKPPQRNVWIESGLTGFFLKKGWMNIEFHEQASKLIKLLPEILETAIQNPKGMIYSIGVNAKSARQFQVL